MRRALAAMTMMLMVGCQEDVAPVGDAGVEDAGATVDVGTGGVDQGGDVVEDAGSVTQDVGQDPVDMGSSTEDAGSGLEVVASNYCELTAQMFCGYYMRCGRISAADEAECLSTFAESCNEVYEPFYAGYAEAGALSLSADGIAACSAHLEQVACEEQIFDLDGGCAGVWEGLVEEGGACAPGIGSFVCSEDTTCVLGLDFCGTCESYADVGQACEPGEVRCGPDAQCVENVCVARPKVGQACDDTVRCITGAYCSDGACVGNQIVTVGQACDQARRCPYRAECRGGFCVQTALLGEACVDRGCASGYCDGAVCQPLRDAFKGCSEHRECVSGRCTSGFCASPVSECLTAE